MLGKSVFRIHFPYITSLISPRPSHRNKSRSAQKKLRVKQASASKSALTNNLDLDGRLVVALRKEDNLLHCPLCMSPLEAKKMNCHTYPANKLTDSSTALGTATSSSNRPHARVQILPSNSPPPDPAAVYTANLWHDEHLAKFSLAIDADHHVLVCQWHKVVVNGSIQAIENHFKRHSHSTSGFHLSVSNISQALDHWRIQTEMLQRPTHAVVPISGVQRVQNNHWEILPDEYWETSPSVDLTPKDLALINAITDSLMNPQVAKNETDDVCVCQPTLS